MTTCLSMSIGRLRPAVAGDLQDLVRLLHEEAVRHYLCDGAVLPGDEIAAMLTSSERLASRGLGLWAIEPAGEPFAGIAGLQPVSGETGEARAMAGGVEPIIAVDPEHWGRGLAGAAIAALILHARRSLGLPRLVAAVDRPNLRSHRLMRRHGFTAMGTAPGPAHQMVLYELPLGETGIAT